MRFLHQVKQSIYGPEFYRQMAVAPTKEALIYFSKLISVVSLISTIIFAVVFVPTATVIFSKGTVNKLIAQIPAELTLTVKDGKVWTNVTEPYFIPLTDTTRDVSTKPAVKNFVVIDTKATADAGSFEKYSTAILVTSDYIIGERGNGQITIQKVKDLPDITISRTSVSEFSNKFIPLLKFIIPAVVLMMLIGSFVGGFVLHLCILLVVTLVIWIVGKVRKTGITYGTYYKLGLFAVTPTILMGIISGLAELPLIVWWALFIILTFISFFINTKFVKQPLS